MTTTTPASDPQGEVLARYEPVIGLEVHCQLATKTKLFCGCPTTFGAQPNNHTCPVCLALPGVLPVLNTLAVDFAIRMALAVGATIRETSVFARKQYFYPDLPKGYQISQFDKPYCEGGGMTLASGKFVRLTRIHLEEDAGKNVHGNEASYVDVNRAGVPLIEIVSEPEIASAEEAAEYLKLLRSLVRYLEISDGNMEEGSFRCDANVSLRRRGETKLGTRCEVKNLNSFRNVERAIWYEIYRQAEELDGGKKITQETRLFNAESGRTAAMRSKADSHDYRYFPDPDLRPLVIQATRVAKVKAALPELPQAKAARFVEQFCLSNYDATLLTAEKDLAAYFEDTVKATAGAVEAKIVANWVTGEVLRDDNQAKVTPARLGSLLKLLGSGTISGKIAKTVFEDMVTTDAEPETIIASKGLVQVSDTAAITTLVKKVLDENPSQLQQYFGGKEKLLGFFVGQIMKGSGGMMNPALVNEILMRELETLRS